MLRERDCQAQKTRNLLSRINILQQCSDNGLRSIYEALFLWKIYKKSRDLIGENMG
jgi:hypothetical protein